MSLPECPNPPDLFPTPVYLGRLRRLYAKALDASLTLDQRDLDAVVDELAKLAGIRADR